MNYASFVLPYDCRQYSSKNRYGNNQVYGIGSCLNTIPARLLHNNILQQEV